MTLAVAADVQVGRSLANLKGITLCCHVEYF